LQIDILFLDGQTKSLTTKEELAYLETVSMLARRGYLIIMTLTAPTMEMFEIIDSVVLLNNDGKLFMCPLFAFVLRQYKGRNGILDQQCNRLNSSISNLIFFNCFRFQSIFRNFFLKRVSSYLYLC